MFLTNHKFIKTSAIFFLTASMAASLMACGGAKSEESNTEVDVTEYSGELFAMDTYMDFTAYGARSEEAVNAVIEEIQHLDEIWSVGNENSEVSIVNREGSCEVSPETGALVKKSLDLYKETDGIFDIAIYPLMVEWGFTTQNYKVPTEERIQELLANVDASQIDYNEETRMLTLPENVQIDLGGIAKGYTSARINEIFREYDIVSGVVCLGGNVQTYGTKTDGSLWRVGIENPDSSLGQLRGMDRIGVLEVANKAVISSGGYERYFEENGKTYHHILDPSTGYPSNSGLIGVTIISDDGCLADGLSTSLFIMGKEKAIDFWREHSDEFDAVLVSDDGSITITEGIKDCFSCQLKYDVAKK